MTYAPIARIILRYIAGGLMLGSGEVGDRLAMDDDLVLALGLGIGVVVEGAYAIAKRKGWTT